MRPTALGVDAKDPVLPAMRARSDVVSLGERLALRLGVAVAAERPQIPREKIIAVGRIGAAEWAGRKGHSGSPPGSFDQPVPRLGLSETPPQ